MKGKGESEGESKGESKISQAVNNCINRLAIAQQNERAFVYIMYDQRNNRSIPPEARAAIHNALYAEITAAWDALSWFAPINKRAIELLAKRTQTWFARDDTSVMHWLGEEGSYYTADKEQFLAEVRAIFTGESVDISYKLTIDKDE